MFLLNFELVFFSLNKIIYVNNMYNAVFGMLLLL